MNREYHRWFSPSLGREMEMLIFGHAGLPAIVFPTSCGRFYEFEDRGMVATVAGKIEAGDLQLFCVDSVDGESWYNRNVSPRWRIARQVQYEAYVMYEAIPLLRQRNWNSKRVALGCSFGGYHAANVALRHPEIFTGFLSMGGAFDQSGFLRGYYDDDCYFHLPTHFMANIPNHDLHRFHGKDYVLATGVHDMCWHENEHLARILRERGIPVRLDVWGDNAGHDWPWWQRMLATYV